VSGGEQEGVREGWPSVLGPREARRRGRVGQLGRGARSARRRGTGVAGGRGRGHGWGPRVIERKGMGMAAGPVRPAS
jgi:hypothetical protein